MFSAERCWALLRQATKNILYTVVNSNVMATVVDGYSTPVWQTVMFAIDAVLVIALAAWGVVVLRKSKVNTK